MKRILSILICLGLVAVSSSARTWTARHSDSTGEYVVTYTVSDGPVQKPMEIVVTKLVKGKHTLVSKWHIVQGDSPVQQSLNPKDLVKEAKRRKK